MGESSVVRNLTMAEGQMKMSEDSVIAIGDEGKSGENIGKMIYSMGDSAGRAYLIAGEETGHRAYIGISDDGSIGEGDEGSERTDGRLPLYKKMADEGYT